MSQGSHLDAATPDAPQPSGRLVRRLLVYLVATACTVMMVRAFHARSGPYFEIPVTVYDHVQPERQLARQAIVMARHAEPLMPRGASLTVIAPEQAPHYDSTQYLTAAGMLPRHRVLHPTLAKGEPWPDFVIALGSPLQHRGYELVREFPEGRLYAVRR